MRFIKNPAAMSLAAVGLCSAAIALTGIGPAGARAFSDAIRACSSGNACLQWSNNGTGAAIAGIGAQNDGLSGKTSGTSASGVYGENDAASGGYAIYGSSPNDGVGIFAYSRANTGVAATSDGGVGLYARAGTAGANPAILAVQNNTSCSPACVPVIVAQVAGTTDVMSVDTKGNMVLSGSLTQNGSPQFVTKTRTGPNVLAYAPRVSQPSLEDFGETRLAGGYARIALDPAFAAAVDGRAGYLVFLTPQGATSGSLYVTDKNATGFSVRELGGGRSTVTFDYRIVAKPLDAPAVRLPAAPPSQTMRAHSRTR